jgi:hypothetical protein
VLSLKGPLISVFTGSHVANEFLQYVHKHFGTTISPGFIPTTHLNTLIHKHKEKHKQTQIYTSLDSQTYLKIHKHTPVTQTHRDSTCTPSHPVSKETHSQECPEWGQAGLGLVPCSRDETRKPSAPGAQEGEGWGEEHPFLCASAYPSTGCQASETGEPRQEDWVGGIV